MALTSNELQQLISLSEAEQVRFWQDCPEDEAEQILNQLKTLGQSSSNRTTGADYTAERYARNAAAINAKTAASQEVGPLPPIADPERRKRCADDNLLFAETYFGPTFYMGWAPYQREMMAAFQRVVFEGGKEVRAVRRGGLKSTCARVSAVWAAVNGHRRFPVLVGATDDKANEHRENFFALLASSALLVDDFPELIPLLLKWKNPKRQFRLDGRVLKVFAKDERGRIVFPDIHDAPSCEVHVAPYSVSATDVSGLSYVDRFGVSVRPDLLCFDDVQTPQSAESPTMTDDRENSVTKTFLGLAKLGGGGISAIMVCTVRQHQDLTERFLDRKRHPDWNGRKYPSVIKMPENAALWDQYAGLLGQGKTPKDGKRLAQDFYVANRELMDSGAVVAWELDKLDDEVSSLQSMMTIRANDPEFFRREIQQEGTAPVNSSTLKLDPQVLMTRLSRVPRGVVPDSVDYLTAFIDSSDQVLWWCVVGWQRDFSGWVIDYGAWPDQGRPHFHKSDLAARISEQLPGKSWEEAFTHAHNELERLILADWYTATGETRHVDLLMKDWGDGAHKPRIESQIIASESKNRIRASKGVGPGPGKKAVHQWARDTKKDRQTGSHWLERRTERPMNVLFDSNIWKSHVARRLMTTIGAPSCLMLPGDDERANRMFVEHVCAEDPVTVTREGQSAIKYELLPGRDNDFFDTLVGCAVGASMLGCQVANEKPSETEKQVKRFRMPTQ